MGAYLTWIPASGPNQSLFFDVVTEESQTLAATVTDHPVEAGVDISDHMRDELDRCSLDVFVSNTPIYDWNKRGARIGKLDLKAGASHANGGKLTYSPPLEPTPGSVFSAVGGAVKGAISSLLGNSKGEYAATVLQWGDTFDAVSETLAVLENLKKTKQLIEVVIPSRLYENMILQQIDVRRNAKSGSGATFHLEFRQLRIVESKLVTAPVPTEIRGAIAKPKGAQAPTDLSDAQAETARKKSVLKAAADRLRGGS